jgi:conjugal transfer/entry exclusion protein
MAAYFSLLPLMVFGMGSGSVVETIQMQNWAPQDLQNFMSAAIDRAEQITTGMNTLLTLNQSLQYQIRAAQALAEGSWDGFVEFFDYQTMAISGYSNSFANLNEITDMFTRFDDGKGDFADVFTGNTYDKLKERAENMSKAMDAANEMVRATDQFVKSSERNARSIEKGLMAAANATNPLQALQGQAQIFAAIAGESQASSQLLHSQQRYLKTIIQNHENNAKNDREKARNFMTSPDSDDPASPYARTEGSDRIRTSLSGRFLDNANKLNE